MNGCMAKLEEGARALDKGDRRFFKRELADRMFASVFCGSASEREQELRVMRQQRQRHLA